MVLFSLIFSIFAFVISVASGIDQFRECRRSGEL